MATRGCSDHAFHVDPHDDHWDVIDQDGRVIAHRHGQAQAIELAIHHAQQAPGNAMVCVQQADGQYVQAWSSH